MNNTTPGMRKRYSFFVSLILMLTLLAGMLTAQQTANHELEYLVVSVSLSQSNILDDIVQQGITILEVDRSRTSAVVLATSEEYAWLSTKNFSPQVVPDDIAKERGWKHCSLLERDFHSYAQMTVALQNMAATYPAITRLYDLGQSVQGRTIWGLKITDNPDVEENEPEVRIIGLHHGNEYMSGELPLLLAYHLVQNYSIDPLITELVDTREIWIIPMMNPDGREAGTRYNAHGVDLNRNYGYMPQSSNPYSEPETQAIRNNALENNFVLSLSFHCSGDIVNYIWNYKQQSSADHAAVVFLSEQYSTHNNYWVTKGYDWYQTLGDCNDFSYGCRGGLDWTIEVQNTNIAQAWNKNRDAMVQFIGSAGMGLTGVVTNVNTGEPLAATVWVDEAYWPCFTDPAVGDYHKVLLPGTYTVHYRANGFAEKTVTVQVNEGAATVFNVALHPHNQFFAYQVTVSAFYAPSNNYQNNPTDGVHALGPPDGLCASLGIGGYLTVDMGVDVTDRPNAADLRVVEGDSTADGYHVYVSMNWNGPWSYLGAGMGTAEFDLADASIPSARYVKIVDDGDGNPNEYKPGADIDAIENLSPAMNLPPDTPSQPQGPQSGGTNVEYTYTTVTNDPENQPVFYQWSWGDSISPWLGPYDSGVVVEATHAWPIPNIYTVKVKAKDIDGLESSWSEPITVHIESAPCIEIGEIFGGFGVTAVIQNTGSGEATNTSWSIVLEGGLVVFGRHTTGNLLKIQPGFSPKVQSQLILGVGLVTIIVTADAAEKNTSALLLGPFVFIKN